MYSKYTDNLTSDNWQEKLQPKHMSLEDALDAFGDVKIQLSLYKKLEGFMKEVVKSKMPEGETEYTGLHFMVVLNERSRAGGLNKELLTEEFGQDWIEEHSKEPTEYVEVRLTRVEVDE